MQLAPRQRQATPHDLATALRTAAEQLGARPAVTLLHERGREEQGVASLAQWAAKGAHLLELDLLLDPGDRIALAAPLSWTSAAVSLAAWWAGIEVELIGTAPDDGADARRRLAVVHEHWPTEVAADEVLWLGDAIDGAPSGSCGEPWVRAVQTFPDQPPPPRATGGSPALRAGERRLSQSDVLRLAAAQGEGTLGVEPDVVDAADAHVAVCARPLVALRPTVILRGRPREAADGERVTAWLDA